jgi:hypothetical protein
MANLDTRNSGRFNRGRSLSPDDRSSNTGRGRALSTRGKAVAVLGGLAALAQGAGANPIPTATTSLSVPPSPLSATPSPVFDMQQGNVDLSLLSPNTEHEDLEKRKGGGKGGGGGKSSKSGGGGSSKGGFGAKLGGNKLTGSSGHPRTSVVKPYVEIPPKKDGHQSITMTGSTSKSEGAPYVLTRSSDGRTPVECAIDAQINTEVKKNPENKNSFDITCDNINASVEYGKITNINEKDEKYDQTMTFNFSDKDKPDAKPQEYEVQVSVEKGEVKGFDFTKINGKPFTKELPVSSYIEIIISAAIVGGIVGAGSTKIADNKIRNELIAALGGFAVGAEILSVGMGYNLERKGYDSATKIGAIIGGAVGISPETVVGLRLLGYGTHKTAECLGVYTGASKATEAIGHSIQAAHDKISAWRNSQNAGQAAPQQAPIPLNPVGGGTLPWGG